MRLPLDGLRRAVNDIVGDRAVPLETIQRELEARGIDRRQLDRLLQHDPRFAEVEQGYATSRSCSRARRGRCGSTPTMRRRASSGSSRICPRWPDFQKALEDVYRKHGIENPWRQSRATNE